MEFLKVEPSSNVNELFTIDIVHGMLEGRDYQCINMVFSFNWAYVDKATGHNQDSELTKVNTICSDLLLELCPTCSKRNTDSRACISSLRRMVRELQDTMVQLFKDR